MNAKENHTARRAGWGGRAAATRAAQARAMLLGVIATPRATFAYLRDNGGGT